MIWTAKVRFPTEARDFSLLLRSRPALGSTQSPVQWVPRAIFLGVKRPGRKADHLTPSSAEDKNGEAISTLAPTSSMHSAELTQGQLHSKLDSLGTRSMKE
jgi:hypothetical protein